LYPKTRALLGFTIGVLKVNAYLSPIIRVLLGCTSGWVMVRASNM
jgi:hypothetical protein